MHDEFAIGKNKKQVYMQHLQLNTLMTWLRPSACDAYPAQWFATMSSTDEIVNISAVSIWPMCMERNQLRSFKNGTLKSQESISYS